MYSAFPVFPGAVESSESSYEITADGRGTGNYGLTVVYRLPPTVSSADVIGFLRSNIPTGWTEASDETCARSAARSPAPPAPVPTMRDGSAVEAPPPEPSTALMLRRSRLTVFVDDSDPSRGGVTFALSGGGDEKWLTLDAATYTCQAPGNPDVDPAADQFDATG